MKNHLILITLLILALSCFGQGATVSQPILPVGIQQHFLTSFPGVENVSWSEGSTYFSAHFVQNGMYMEVKYSSDGQFLLMNASTTPPPPPPTPEDEPKNKQSGSK